MYFVKVNKKAAKASLKMPEFYRKRIAELIDLLKINPIPAELYDLQKMEGEEHTYRVRIGSIRIVYTVIRDAELIEISRIEWRGRAYK